MVDKNDKSRWRRDPFDPDPLNIRGVTLGGDEPGLQSEIDHINRKKPVLFQEEENIEDSSKKE